MNLRWCYDGFEFSSNGQILAVMRRGGTLCLFEKQGDCWPQYQNQLIEDVLRFKFSPDSKTLAVRTRRDSCLKVFEKKGDCWKVIKKKDYSGIAPADTFIEHALSFHFSSDSKLLLVGTTTGTTLFEKKVSDWVIAQSNSDFNYYSNLEDAQCSPCMKYLFVPRGCQYIDVYSGTKGKYFSLNAWNEIEIEDIDSLSCKFSLNSELFAFLTHDFNTLIIFEIQEIDWCSALKTGALESRVLYKEYNEPFNLKQFIQSYGLRLNDISTFELSNDSQAIAVKTEENDLKILEKQKDGTWMVPEQATLNNVIGSVFLADQSLIIIKKSYGDAFEIVKLVPSDE